MVMRGLGGMWANNAIAQLMKDQEQNVRSWEAGRTRLLDDHKLKRENERTHRAAL